MELIHIDLWGPTPTISLNGFKYYFQFLDDYSRYVWVYPLKLKSEALSMFVKFQTMVELHFETNIKILQSDWGVSFVHFYLFLAKQGINFHHLCPYLHAQNGKVEKKHRHIVEVGLNLLAKAKMPIFHWWDVFRCVVYIINGLPIQVLQFLDPYQLLFHKLPYYQFFRSLVMPVIPFFDLTHLRKLNSILKNVSF